MTHDTEQRMQGLVARNMLLAAALQRLLPAYRQAVKLFDPNTDDALTVQARNALAGGMVVGDGRGCSYCKHRDNCESARAGHDCGPGRPSWEPLPDGATMGSALDRCAYCRWTGALCDGGYGCGAARGVKGTVGGQIGASKSLPKWTPCNEGCDPACGGFRTQYCKCPAANAALGVTACTKCGGAGTVTWPMGQVLPCPRCAYRVPAFDAPKPVAYHDKDQPNGIAWCPGYPEGLKDITPLYASGVTPSQPQQQSERIPCATCTSEIYCEMNGCKRPRNAGVALPATGWKADKLGSSLAWPADTSTDADGVKASRHQTIPPRAPMAQGRPSVIVIGVDTGED